MNINGEIKSKIEAHRLLLLGFFTFSVVVSNLFSPYLTNNDMVRFHRFVLYQVVSNFGPCGINFCF